MVGSMEGNTSPIRSVLCLQKAAGCSSLTSDPCVCVRVRVQVYLFQPGRRLPVQRGHRLSAGLRLGAGPLLRRGAGGLGESL